MSYLTISESTKKALILEALEIAQNSLEYDGEQFKADSLSILIAELKGELN